MLNLIQKLSLGLDKWGENLTISNPQQNVEGLSHLFNKTTFCLSLILLDVTF